MKLAHLAPLSCETIGNAKRLGYDAIEVKAGWRDGSALPELERELPALREALNEHEISISAVAIYGDTILSSVKDSLVYWTRAFDMAQALGSRVVAGMTGRDNAKTVEENLPLFLEHFGPIVKTAEEREMLVALEPWPGPIVGHGPYVWRNLATTPELWDRLFETIPSPALGLEYDPSHLVWQGIDHLQAIHDYGDRIHHVHAKDIAVDETRLAHVGVHGHGWWRFVIPGLGRVDWPAIFAALREVGYRGDVAVEHEDREYLRDRWNEGLSLGLKTLRPLLEES